MSRAEYLKLGAILVPHSMLRGVPWSRECPARLELAELPRPPTVLLPPLDLPLRELDGVSERLPRDSEIPRQRAHVLTLPP